MTDPKRLLRRLFRRERVLDMPGICAAMEGRSRRSLFRDLVELGYWSSFTHAGRFYTLHEIPEFDQDGLWFFRGEIGFSRVGTLKETVAVHVEESAAGKTHAELREVLRVRVHNALLELVRAGRIGRAEYEVVHLYVHAEAERAAQQIKTRQALDRIHDEALRALRPDEIVETLVEALRAAPEVPDVAVVSQRLAARGIRLSSMLVGRVYETYGLVPGKKKAERRS